MDWKEIKKIVNIADNMIDLDIQDKLPECCATEEGYYKEILKKYNETKQLTGIDLITEEREKQISKYGYTPEHDSGYKSYQLVFGALAYLNTAIYGKSVGEEDWPFDAKYFHDEGYVESLKKAGAFIVAELDRVSYNKKENSE